MEWHAPWDDPCSTYLAQFDGVLGDARTRTTFTETVTGIIAAGSRVCQRIAAPSPVRAAVPHGAQRIIRMVTRESTTRSPALDAAHLTATLRTRAVEHLGSTPAAAVWLIADGSALRQPPAQAMPPLMRVKDLEGGLVNGYRTLTVLAITPHRRGVPYHRRVSSKAPGFVSASHDVQQALTTGSQAIAPLKNRLTAPWIVDSGSDAIAVGRTSWEQDEPVVGRVKHPDRLLAFPERAGAWHAGDIAPARPPLRRRGTAETMVVVQRGRQPRPKEQRVAVEIWAGPVRVRSATNVRRAGAGAEVEKPLWLVDVRIPAPKLEPWLLLTDWPVVDEPSAVRIFCRYRQRWAAAARFTCTKDCLGWEAVQVMDLAAVRTRVALAWGAAGLLDELGVTLEWAAVWLLARLGGGVPHKDRKPGKIPLTRGLRRLIEMLTTAAILTAYWKEHRAFPPQIAAFLKGWQPPEEL